MLEYRKLTDDDLDVIIKNYVDYYNQSDEDCWTYEKAYKRIHQVMTIEDSECLVQYDKNEMIGFVMGYYKQYDDLKAYCLEEILVFKEYQNKGYGTRFMEKLELKMKEQNVELIELISVNDEHHIHFYQKLGYYTAKNLVSMGKLFKK